MTKKRHFEITTDYISHGKITETGDQIYLDVGNSVSIYSLHIPRKLFEAILENKEVKEEFYTSKAPPKIDLPYMR